MPAVLEERRPLTPPAPVVVVTSPVAPSPVENLIAPASAPPVPRRRRRSILLGVVLSIVTIGIAVAIYEFIQYSHFVSTDDAFIEGHVVAISPQVSARIKAVLIDDNVLVHKGQLMVELDPTDFDIAVNQAKATVAAMAGKADQAAAEIDSAGASLDEAKAELEVAEANLTNSTADLKRFEDLAGKNNGAVSRQQLDSAKAIRASNFAQVRQAQAKQKQAEADVATRRATAEAAKGDVLKANADVAKAVANLSYCRIVAPEDGRVTRKNVEPGSYVQAGEQLFAIVQTDVWVVANFKETQMSRMHVGDDVSIEVDAYPGMKLHGHVDTFQYGTGSRFSMLPAENATGNFVKVVQRVPCKIKLDNPPVDTNRPLALGMSVLPEVSLK